MTDQDPLEEQVRFVTLGFIRYHNYTFSLPLITAGINEEYINKRKKHPTASLAMTMPCSLN